MSHPAPIAIYARDIIKRARPFAIWERYRNRDQVHWLMEMFAEGLGVFFYVYAGVGSTASFVVGQDLGIIGLSSMEQIGFAYAFGILFAIITCSATSGGHFNPGMTACYVLYKGFPPLKALRYVFAQILGAYIACLLIYAQYKELIVASEGALAAAGKLEELRFTPNAPAGIFAFYLLPGQTHARVFLNEWVSSMFIGIVFWSVLDPTNVRVPPVLGPVMVALSYAVVIWGYALPNIALNTARDVGGRLVALTYWGIEAGGGRYAAIAALTNIPATVFGAFLYEVFLTDYDRVIPQATQDYAFVESNNARFQPSKDPQKRRQSHISRQSYHGPMSEMVGVATETEVTNVPIKEKNTKDEPSPRQSVTIYEGSHHNV